MIRGYDVGSRSADLEPDRLPLILIISNRSNLPMSGTFSMAASDIHHTDCNSKTGFGEQLVQSFSRLGGLQRKIARFKRKYEFWNKELFKADMVSDLSLIETRGESEKLLEQEQAKLKGRTARCGPGCWSKVSRTMFTAKVGLRIELEIDAFDAIPGCWQMEVLILQ